MAVLLVAVSADPKPEAKPEAKPGLIAPLAYSAAPLVAVSSPYIAATSSQSFVRNYNGLAAAPFIAAPVASAYRSAYVSPYAYAAAYSPYVTPLKYTAAPILL